MSSPRFPASVDSEGRLVPTHPERTLRYRGKQVWVSIHLDPVSHTRSSKSNAYLWSVIYGMIAEETGNDPETIHQALKLEARRVGVLEPQYVVLGNKLLEDGPTTKVEQEQFSKYVDWIKEGCATGSLIGSVLVIPEPGE